ncbi:hypothetical protein VitviT2T_030660 [Vitis vinifera]|uniref:NB-ARC domain-containing protein n=2 Tax=Vitis vinifera TaxID=29760 RepID=A0ABY9E074_VITVI|nr:hypothetical protein VitviT2T_030660 [Vitis vinifera]
MDFVIPVLDIASCSWDCIAKRAVYIPTWNTRSARYQHPENLNSLRTAVEDLKNVYEDEKEKVDREEKLRKKRTRAVDGWIQSVEAMEKEVNDLLAKGDEDIQKKCLGTCCPKNYRASYNIGKMVHGKMDEVALKKTEGFNFSVVAEPLPSPTVIERPLDKMVGLDSLFDHVYQQMWRRFSEFFSINWRFLVTWEGRSEDERKEAIFNVLKMKKIVILLDDIWEPLDLFAVGIPPVNDGSKSKVVFTTRFSTVCRDMGAKKRIEVKCLEWAEAFALFQIHVGEDTINSHPHLPKLAEIVAKECDGLPLALITIGRAMAGVKTPEEWEKKIQMLKNYPAKFPGMENHLFSRLAFSYDSLHDEVVQSCFLYCSLFPEDYEIDCDRLVQLWIGEGFLDEYDDIKEARNGGEEIIASLNHACLLEVNDNIDHYLGERARFVKMHDIIRDMALWLSCQNGNKKQNRFVVVDGGELVTSQ